MGYSISFFCQVEDRFRLCHDRSGKGVVLVTNQTLLDFCREYNYRQNPKQITHVEWEKLVRENKITRQRTGAQETEIPGGASVYLTLTCGLTKEGEVVFVTRLPW